MSVRLPPSSRNGSVARPIIQKRKFRIVLEYLECHRQHSLDMTLYDEPDDAATKHDVDESGVFGQIRFRCEASGFEQASFDAIRCVRGPNDLVRMRPEATRQAFEFRACHNQG